MTVRPFRAVVYLPGHLEGGVLVKSHHLSFSTREGLAKACDALEAEGYRTKRYEVVPLDIDLPTPEGTPDHD